VRPLSCLIALLSLLGPVAAGCSSSPQPQAARPAAAREPVGVLASLDRSRWMPASVEGGELMETMPDGTQRVVLQRLRVELNPQGALRRARDLLPTSRPAASAQLLPERLGGGHLFVTFGSGSSLWRARNFLGKLEPLVRLSVAPIQVTPGPDRLLIRSIQGDRLLGVDAESGAIESPLPLPAAPRYGPFAFSDARHGLVVADLQGLLFTSDAGASWRRVPTAELPRAIGVEGDLLALQTSSGRQRFDPISGNLLEGTDRRDIKLPRGQGENRKERGFLGDRPLIAVVEDGWPLLDGSAVVMRAGQVGRVRLEDGALIEASVEPLPGEEATTCKAVRYGVDVGFVCGAPGRGTTIYAYAPPVGVTTAATFDEARIVVPSGNGWLVVKGGCARDAPLVAPGGGSSYCVVAPGGALREVYTRGDVGVERLVALADGRVAVLVPPRGATDGQLTLLPARDEPLVTLKLELPEEIPALRRGLWLEGPIDIGDDEISGWVEAGGSLQGIRIRIKDGTVIAGRAREEPMMSIAGPWAVIGSQPDQLQETVDGGMNWRPMEMPPNLGQGKLAVGLRCGAAGCVVPFERGTWVRAGWGPPQDPTDLDDAEERGQSSSRPPPPRSMRFRCDVRRIDALAPGEDGLLRRAPRRPPPRVPRGGGEPPPALPPFSGTPPPVVPAGMVALSDGTSAGASARVYAWAPKGVAPGRSGRFVGRFFDRFSAGDPVRSTALSIAPWHDEQAFLDAFGSGPTSSSVVLHGLPDPSGQAVLLSMCHSGGRCDLFGMVEGRPIQPLATDDELAPRVFWPSASAIWIDESWVLALNNGAQTVIWRLDASRARVLARIPRMTATGQAAPTSLIRRAHGGQVGLLARGVGSTGASEQEIFVLPLDPETGQVGDLLRLGPPDLGGRPAPACSDEDDGWVFEHTPPAAPTMALEPAKNMGSVTLRVRAEPGQVCIEAAQGELQDTLDAKMSPSSSPRKGFPLLLSGAGKRLLASCAP
jgi:hypothetical protein